MWLIERVRATWRSLLSSVGVVCRSANTQGTFPTVNTYINWRETVDSDVKQQQQKIEIKSIKKNRSRRRSIARRTHTHAHDTKPNGKESNIKFEKNFSYDEDRRVADQNVLVEWFSAIDPWLPQHWVQLTDVEVIAAKEVRHKKHSAPLPSHNHSHSRPYHSSPVTVLL